MLKALELAAANPGRWGLIGSPTFPMLRDTTQRAFFDFCDEHEIEYQFKRSENRVSLRATGSEILFRSLDKFERLRGTNLAWFGIDELTYCTESAWLRLEARLRDPLAKELSGFGVWTPKGFDWVYRRFIDPARGELQKSLYSATLARPRENRHLPADFYDRLAASYAERFAAQEIEGEYLNICSGRAYYAFDRRLHVTSQRYRIGTSILWALDFNVDPMCSVICQIEDTTTREEAFLGRSSAKLRVLDEIALRDSNTLEACEEFERRLERLAGNRDLNIVIYGDAAGAARSTAGKSDYQIIREYFRARPHLRASYKVGSSNPKVRDRVNAVNAKLRNAVRFIGVQIDPSCKTLIQDLEQVVFKADANGNMTGELDKSDKERTHMSDAFGYLIEREFGFRQHGGPRSGSIA